MAGAISATTLLAGTAAAAGVAGAGMSAAGSIKGGQAASQTASARKQMAYYQAQVSRNNATVARQNAEYAMAAGQGQAGNQSLVGAAKFGRLKAGQGASGVNANGGSAVDVQASERSLNQLDSETVLANAALKSYGYQVQAANYEAQANLDMSGGQLYGQQSADALTSGYLQAGGSLLSAASSLPFSWGGGGGDFLGTAAGASAYGSPANNPSMSYGGPR